MQFNHERTQSLVNFTHLLLTAIYAGVFLFVAPATAEIRTSNETYKFDGKEFKGFIAWDDSSKEKRPGILLVHEWWGLNDYARGRAKQLAQLGYVAFAVDMYGDGRNSDHPKDAGEMSAAVLKNEALLLGRARAGLKVLTNHEAVDSNKIAAIGYCFGGAVVLKLAYSGENLDAVVSFHGSIPEPSDASKIKARVLVCNGAEDTFVPQEAIKKFKSALDQAKIPYRFENYPGAQHGFTVQGADERGMKGVAYNAEADKLSWQAMRDLFSEVF